MNCSSGCAAWATLGSARVLETANAGIRVLLAAVLSRLAFLPPALTLSILATALAVVLLLVVRVVSAPAKIAQAKREIAAGLYELRLFSQEPRALWSAQRAVIAAQARYLRHSALPLALSIVIVVPAMAHLDPYFYSAGTGRTLVAATLDTRSVERPDIRLEPAQNEVRVEDATWLPATARLLWNVSSPGNDPRDLALRSGRGPSVTIPFVAGSRFTARPPVRQRPGFVSQLLEPGAPPLPDDSGLSRIEIAYSTMPVDVLGWSVPWEVVFVAALFVAMAGLRRPFGVEF